MYEPYGQNGLFGLKYNSVGGYYGEDKPINVIEISGQTLEGDNLRTEIENIFIRMIIDTISEIKDMLGIINYDDDYLVFMCDHDISNDDFEKWVRKTNDDKLVVFL